MEQTYRYRIEYKVPGPYGTVGRTWSEVPSENPNADPKDFEDFLRRERAVAWVQIISVRRLT